MNKFIKNKGFTIVELLIVVAIVGILMVVALPNFMDIINRSNTDSAARSIVNTLNMARSEAVNRGEDIHICPTSDGVDCDADSWSNGWIVFFDENNDADGDTDSIDANDITIQVYQPLGAMVLTEVSGLDLSVYDSRGFGKNGATQVFKVCPQDNVDANARAIRVSMSGRARVINDIGSEGLSCP